MSVQKTDSNSKENFTLKALNGIQALSGLQASLGDWCQAYQEAASFLAQSEFRDEAETTWQMLRLSYSNLDSLIRLVSQSTEEKLKERLL